jgi:Putative Ig domain
MQTVTVPAGRRACRTALLSLVGLAIAFDASAYHRRYGHVSISGSPATTDMAGQAYSFTPTISTPSGYTPTFAISGKPAWASFSTSTGRLSGTPALANVGTYSNIVLTVAAGPSTASLAAFSIAVTSPPDKTTISGQPAPSVNVGATYSFTPSAADSNGYPLTFSIQNAPGWATFITATGQLSGTPSSTYVGSYSNIIITASDGLTKASLAPFSIAVNQISNGMATVNWTPPLSNTDGSALTDLAGYRVYYGTASNNLAQNIQITNVGTASYTLSNLTSGNWYFGVSAYDSGGRESALSNVASKTIP